MALRVSNRTLAGFTADQRGPPPGRLVPPATIH